MKPFFLQQARRFSEFSFQRQPTIDTHIRFIFKQDNGSDHARPLLIYSNNNAQKELTVELKKSFGMYEFRKSIYQAISTLQNNNIYSASMLVEDLPYHLCKTSKFDLIKNIMRITSFTSHSFNDYKSKPKGEFKHLEICTDGNFNLFEGLKENNQIEMGAVIKARDLGNLPADTANPDYLEHVAREIISNNESKMKIQVIKGRELVDLNLNLIHEVGKASRWEPRLIIIEYDNSNSQLTSLNENLMAFVGKGVVFDSGGLNLKSEGFIENMHLDMCGAADVLAIASAVASFALPLRLIFALPVVENCISAEAYKPGGIIKSYSGKTVEIGNTDAEGRLILADTLSYIQEKYTPSTIIDFATLTGASKVALGEYSAALFSNDDLLASRLLYAASQSNEYLWQMPIFPEHDKELKSKFADIKSTGSGKGGACTAAAFLQSFVKSKTAWAHLDIAGPAKLSAQVNHLKQGGTGYGVLTALQFLQNVIGYSSQKF